MELREALRRRRMVRSYDPDRSVPEEALDRLLIAAVRAPSAGHSQGVSFLVLTERADVARFWECTADARGPDQWLRGMRTAPVLVLVWTSAEVYLDRYARADKGWLDRDPGRWSAPYWYVDAGMASMAVLLSAVDCELGACFFGVPTDRIPAVRRAFGVPEDQLSVGVISVGYPDPAVVSKPSARARRPLSERLHRGRWVPPEPDAH